MAILSSKTKSQCTRLWVCQPSGTIGHARSRTRKVDFGNMFLLHIHMAAISGGTVGVNPHSPLCSKCCITATCLTSGGAVFAAGSGFSRGLDERDRKIEVLLFRRGLILAHSHARACVCLTRELIFKKKCWFASAPGGSVVLAVLRWL